MATLFMQFTIPYKSEREIVILYVQNENEIDYPLLALQMFMLIKTILKTNEDHNNLSPVFC